MARRHRFRITGLSQHIVQRGNNRMDIFRSDEDYDVWLTLLREASRSRDLDVNAYVAMRNHFHILATPRRKTAVEEVMHLLDFQYARYFNRRYERTGSPFEGRYRPTIIDTERYWYSCMRYVELNPVRAGIVSHPKSYSWSSHAHHAFGTPDPLVTLHPLYLALGLDPADRQRCWREHCAEALGDDELDRIRQSVRSGGILGALVIKDDSIDTADI
jgi:putative transposase